MNLITKAKIIFSFVWKYFGYVLSFIAKHINPDEMEMAIMLVGNLMNKNLSNSQKSSIAVGALLNFLKSKKPAIAEHIKENPIRIIVETALNCIKNGDGAKTNALDIISKRLLEVIKDRSISAIQKELVKNNISYSRSKVKELIELAKNYNESYAEVADAK